MAESSDARRSRSIAGSLLRSKALWIGMLVMLAGGAWWAWTAISAEPPPASLSPLAGGLVDAGAKQPSGAAELPPAPWAFRLGAAFVGGFFLGWLLRRFITLTLVIGGVLVAGIAILKWTGALTLDWSALEQQVEAGLEQTKEHAFAAQDALRAYLPSGIAGVVGMFFGFRR